MKPRRFASCVAVLFLMCLALRADIVTEWNALLLEAIRNESTSPPLAARNLAILHAAIYDAVNGIERTHQSYLFAQTAMLGASAEAAAVAAAHECLDYLYPSQSATFDSAYNTYLTNSPANQSRADGLSFGEWIAQMTLSFRNSDGSSTTVPYIPSNDPGAWRRTPPFYRPPELPQWPYVTPFAMTNGAQFRPGGPPALDSPRYAQDVNQVKQLGALNSTNRTPEQTQTARFWSDFNYTITPPGHWNQIAQNICTNLGCSLSESARLFALLNFANADSAIAAWDAKYYYNFWRPVTAIQFADLDGNTDTLSDTNWVSLLTTPAFPEYISGHSTFSAASATVLALFAGSNNVPFTVVSDALPGVVRSYSNLWTTAEEIGMSRIYGGIHFLSADLDALATGQAIGNYVFQNFLLPLPARITAVARLPNGALQCRATSIPGGRYLFQASTNLLHWDNLSTNLATGTTLDWADSTAPGYPGRFYRLQSLP